MKTAWRRRFIAFAVAESALAELFTRIVRRLKSALSCLTSTQYRTMTPLDPVEERMCRAIAIIGASVSLKGEYDAERLLGLADEFYQYITGDDGAQIPRPDKASKGRLPKC